MRTYDGVGIYQHSLNLGTTCRWRWMSASYPGCFHCGTPGQEDGWEP